MRTAESERVRIDWEERITGEVALKLYIRRGDDWELVGVLLTYPAELDLIARELRTGKIYVPIQPPTPDNQNI